MSRTHPRFAFSFQKGYPRLAKGEKMLGGRCFSGTAPARPLADGSRRSRRER